jgi:hypothetical protein
MSRRSQTSPSRSALPDAELRVRLDFSDAQLLVECTIHTYRASGPGGQHRNKTSSAVRLHHTPSGLIVTATESRSQHENKARALRRLREALALAARLPLPTEISWPASVQVVEKRLRVNRRNPGIYHVLALVLDALAASGGSLRDAAACLDLTPSGLTRFLAEHSKAWAEANRIRRAAGRPALRI